jgi:hypothetical protein
MSSDFALRGLLRYLQERSYTPRDTVAIEHSVFGTACFCKAHVFT